MEMPELLGFLNGKPPRELGEDACPYVSDVQHAFWHTYGVYARPFWVLQGDKGGNFGQQFDQRRLLAHRHLQIEFCRRMLPASGQAVPPSPPVRH